MTMLEGSVVYIDDEWNADGSTAKRMYDQLWDSGRPMRAYSDIPPDDHLDHWDGLSMVILDWNLLESDTRVEGAAELQESAREDILTFLSTLLNRYFCPVFIVSSSDQSAIETALRDAEEFPTDALGPRVRVVHKQDVHAGILETLEQNLAEDPVLSTLRTWELQYQLAKNRMFIDFSDLGPDWLVYLVKAADEDKTDAGYELVDFLYANLRHRVNPIAFQLDGLLERQLPEDADKLRKVLHGRSVLGESALYPTTVMPGDFFLSWRRSDPDHAIWLNITPACYTARNLDSVKLHLIRGVPVEVLHTQQPNKLRSLRQKETKSATVDVLYEGKAYKFDFNTLDIVKWTTISKHRKGRLLAPFIVDVQQRHATYLTSEGIPAILPSIYSAVQVPPQAAADSNASGDSGTPA